MAAWNMKLARERRHPLPRHHPLYRRKLELSAEHTAFALGHRSLLENCPLFLCLMLGVHSMRPRGPARACDCGPASAVLQTKRPPEGAASGSCCHWRHDGARHVAIMKNARRWRTPGAIPTMDFLLPRFWDFGQRKCAKCCQESS